MSSWKDELLVEFLQERVKALEKKMSELQEMLDNAHRDNEILEDSIVELYDMVHEAERRVTDAYRRGWKQGATQVKRL